MASGRASGQLHTRPADAWSFGQRGPAEGEQGGGVDELLGRAYAAEKLRLIFSGGGHAPIPVVQGSINLL